MAIPEIELNNVDTLFNKYYKRRVSLETKKGFKLLYLIKGNKVVLIESRPYREDPSKWSERPVAQFEYTEATKGWSLFGRNSDTKALFYIKGQLEKLIQEVDKDSTGVFWGMQKLGTS